MTSGALSSVAFGVVRAVAVVAILLVVVGVVAFVLARKLARTKRARQGVFLGLSGTGLVFVAVVTWTWLQSLH